MTDCASGYWHWKVTFEFCLSVCLSAFCLLYVRESLVASGKSVCFKNGYRKCFLDCTCAFSISTICSCSTSSLVESDANANLRDLYQALAKTSPSTTGTGLQKQSKDDRCEDNETGIAGRVATAAALRQ